MIAVISDIHSNLEALKAVLKDIKKREIEEIYCAGDIVGYNADPNQCINLLREHNVEPVQGNHDLGCASLKGIRSFNDYGIKAARWQHHILTKKNKQYLMQLPKTLEKNFFLVHGSPENPLKDYIYEDTSPWRFKKFFAETHHSIVIMGHTHIPFQKHFPNFKMVLNPGSVGQPRDKNPKASYAILDIEEQNAQIVRVKYNIKQAANKIKKSKLPDFSARRLFEGK